MADKNRRWWMVVSVGIVILALVSVIAFEMRSGIRVTVENTGTSPLKSVLFHVTGASYNSGEIAPGSSATARVNPTSESHLEIEFTDADEQTQRLDAGGYFESGYRGTTRVSIKDSQIDKNEQDIKPW